MNNNEVRTVKYDNKFPGSIGFINDTTEIFVEKENLYNRLFNPHFYLYNHETDEFTEYEFKDTKRFIEDKELFEYLKRVDRLYKDDKMLLPRINYLELIDEWEIVNNFYFRRKFMYQ